MDKIKRFLKKLKIGNIGVSIALIIGLLFIIFPDGSATVICYFAGGVLALWGVILLITYFSYSVKREGSFDFAAGVALICVAVLLFVKPALVAEFITVIFGIALIVDGAVKVQQSVALFKLKSKSAWFILVLAVVSAVLGVILAFNPFSSHNALMIFAGASLIADGVLDLTAAVFVRKGEEDEDEKIIELGDEDIRKEE